MRLYEVYELFEAHGESQGVSFHGQNGLCIIIHIQDLDLAVIFQYGSEGVLEWMGYSIHMRKCSDNFFLSVKSGMMNEASKR